jgi:hypothetical protein
MSEKIYEKMKMDIGLDAQTINNSNAVGRYLNMTHFRKALVLMNVGAMAAAKTAALTLMQATDSSGTSAKAVDGFSATITANTNVQIATIALATVANTDVVVINGLSYTKAAATSEADREFADAAGLVACVNHATYGVDGVVASVSTTTVTVKALEDFDITLSKTEVAGTVTLATTSALAFVEIDNFDLDVNNGFTHFAPKITSTANGVCNAVVTRDDPRYGFVQNVADYDS